MTHPIPLLRLLAGSGALLAALAAPMATAATRAVDEHRSAEANGQIEIQNVAGQVDVIGWDKTEVAVGGTLGADVERLDVTSAGPRTTIRVVLHDSHGINIGWHDSGEAKLIVHVPAGSSLTATMVSADLSVTGIAGNQELHTVSGDIRASAQREVRVQTVSGDVRLTAGPESRLIDVKTVSGDLTVSGGGGELAVKTVSGDGALTLGTLNRAQVNTVSGDFTIVAGLAADGRLEAESVSGDFRIEFTGGVPPAAYELKSFSGDLSTCFGHKAAHEGYGPGSRLAYQEGAGSARVRVDTKSGDVTLCSKK
jgi:hypothetical protein